VTNSRTSYFAAPQFAFRLLICSACLAPAVSLSAPGSDAAAPVELVFFNPEQHAGQALTVSGYLRYAFEDYNLYPDEASSQKNRKKSCLPVLIKRSDKDRLAAAEALDGKYVVIEGTVEDVAPPGMTSFFACKPQGIKVETIRLRP
jgi:hypothetical protein